MWHRFSAARRWAWVLGATFATGCASEPLELREVLSRRTDPPATVASGPISGQVTGPAAKPTAWADPMLSRTRASQDGDGRKATPEEAAKMGLPPAIEEASSANGLDPQPPRPVATAADPNPDDSELDAIIAAGRPLNLPEAIGLAFSHQPRLRAQLESIAQARGRQEVVGSIFLPTAGVSGSAGGYEVNAGGNAALNGLKVPSGFTFLPSTGVLPIGFNIGSGYELVDFKLQWLITDFGRRLGRYEQARLAVDVAQLQTDRAFQTVSNEVSVAYYDVLKAQAFRATAQDATRRAEEQLGDARKLESEGAVERETVLRAEVLRAEARQQLHSAVEAEFVAMAGLNLAIGLRCGEPIRVAEPEGLPSFDLTLADCLQAAIRDRREFRVAKRMVEISQAGTRVARAEFAPKVMAGGNLINIRQNSNSGYGDIAIGFIRVEWELFEGGRRSAERRIADSRLREAVAQVESIADTIAFQVNEAYRRMNAARLGIEDARPAVEQATENYRLVRLRAAEGSATPTEITDAQASLTRAQQNDQNARYAYLTAIARLEYVMGSGPTPANLAHDEP
jgi:outer membrane protein TolC